MTYSCTWPQAYHSSFVVIGAGSSRLSVSCVCVQSTNCKQRTAAGDRPTGDLDLPRGHENHHDHQRGRRLCPAAHLFTGSRPARGNPRRVEDTDEQTEGERRAQRTGRRVEACGDGCRSVLSLHVHRIHRPAHACRSPIVATPYRSLIINNNNNNNNNNSFMF